MKPGEDILADIDATLDQLIKNADVLHYVPIRNLEENEIEALQKTQESLLARLMHMEDLLGAKRDPVQCMQIQKKISQFSKLNARLINNVASRFKTKPRVHRKKLIKIVKGK